MITKALHLTKNTTIMLIKALYLTKNTTIMIIKALHLTQNTTIMIIKWANLFCMGMGDHDEENSLTSAVHSNSSVNSGPDDLPARYQELRRTRRLRHWLRQPVAWIPSDCRCASSSRGGTP